MLDVVRGTWSECVCSCHDASIGDPEGMHIVMCCAICDYCFKNIAGDLKKHIEDEHPG